MKLSVSLPPSDVEFVDQYRAAHGEASRSAVLRRALERLREDALGDEHECARDESQASDDAALREAAADDGLETGAGPPAAG